MKNIKILAIALILSVLTISCSKFSYQKAKIKNIKNAETILLKKTAKQGNIHSIKIRGIGEIEGEAKISLILNNKEYKTEKISGKVNIEWNGDWYSDFAEIIYTPFSVKRGFITIKYCFIDI